jgi:hypothetical protein
MTPGTKLGSYEITALIGKGGMREVYRATEILPEGFSRDPDRVSRFQPVSGSASAPLLNVVLNWDAGLRK